MAKSKRPEYAVGHKLHPKTLMPVEQYVDVNKPGDYGADPLGDGRYRMVPSGDIVDEAERNRRLPAVAGREMKIYANNLQVQAYSK